jgi:hypothetical protein
MKSQLMLETRPRISGGVANWRMLERTTTEIMSVAPMMTRATQLRVILRLRPKTTVAAPKRPTQKSMILPARCLMG